LIVFDRTEQDCHLDSYTLYVHRESVQLNTCWFSLYILLLIWMRLTKNQTIIIYIG